MGCTQSCSVLNGGAQQKKHNLSSNLIVTSHKDFRQDYEIVSTIGKGSISNIYKIRAKNTCQDVRKDQLYAFKEIDASLVNPVYLNEMRNEIDLMRNMTHPNILKIFQVYNDKKSGHIGIVIELCSGGNLNKRAPYTEEQARVIVAKLLEAVNYLHKRGIVHRDIKFENIMFENKSESAEINLIDFGLSTKFLKGQHLDSKVGTVYTMSPEQLRGDYGSEADLWAIGVVAYQLLSGDKPFWGKTRKETAHQVVKGQYSFASPKWKHISPQAKDFITKLLVKDPKARYTAPQALIHPWVAKVTKTGDLSKSERFRVYESLDSYRENPELKKLALQQIAHKATSEEVIKLRDIFHSIDISHEGTITLKELRRALSKKYSENDINELFKNVDVNKSGSIDYTEFLAATLEAHISIEEDRIREAFQVFDRSNTGYISRDDLRQILGKNTDPSYVESLINGADRNNDNQISWSEFKILFEAKNTEKVAEIRNTISSGTSSMISY